MQPQDPKDPYAAIMQKYNYTPPASSGQPVSSAQDFNDFMNKSGNYAASPTPDTMEHPKLDGASTFSSVGGAIGDAFNKRADNVGKIENSGDNPLSKVLQIGGEGAGVLNDSVGEVIKSAIKPEVLQSFGAHLAPLVHAAASNPVGQAVINWWQGLNPETQRNLSAGGQIASLLSNAVGAGAAKEVATEGIDLGINSALKSTVQPAVDAVKPIADTAKDTVTEALPKIKEAIKPTVTPEEAVGHVIQGKTEDVPAALRTLQTIDTKGVKTYADLQVKIKNEIKPLAQKVDAELAKDTGSRTTSQFEQTVGEGESAVKVNYVQRAMDDLKTFYQKTGDAAGESKIKTLEAKANDTGLTAKEVNDLARTHGSTINAFNANGEAASGLTKQAAENTRTGLKEIARQGLGGKEAQALDAKLSDLYDTQALVDKMVEKVNKAKQKTPKTGVLSNIVPGIVKTVDMATGNPLKAIGKEMGSLGASGEMSATELESNLAKYLKTIKRI